MKCNDYADIKALLGKPKNKKRISLISSTKTESIPNPDRQSTTKTTIITNDLTHEQECFVTLYLASFVSGNQIIQAFKTKFDKAITYQELAQIRKKYAPVIKAKAKEFLENVTEIPLYHPEIRLREYQYLAEHNRDSQAPGCLAVAVQAIKYAGEEYDRIQKTMMDSAKSNKIMDIILREIEQEGLEQEAVDSVSLQELEQLNQIEGILNESIEVRPITKLREVIESRELMKKYKDGL